MNQELFNTAVAIMATISLFLFSLRGFSHELQKVGSERMKRWLGNITRNRFRGLLLGAVLTAVIQSSSAVTSITVSLVDSGVITFLNSLAVMVGTNIGTTFTAWLVTFKLDALGPYLLIAGSVIGFLPQSRIQVMGKSVFYLGLILFSLHLISASLTPIKSSPIMMDLLSASDTLWVGILSGALVTFVVQSSSVTTGLIIILAGEGMVSLSGAIAVVVGSNIGTTSTAFLAAASLNRNAKLAALANLTFNLTGLLFFIPMTGVFTRIISTIDADVTIQVALAHLIFNLTVAALVFPWLKRWGRFLDKQNKKPTEETLSV